MGRLQSRIQSILSLAIVFLMALCTYAEDGDSLWLHNTDKFGEHTLIGDMTQFDSIEFRNNAMRLYYKKELGKAVEYVQRTYPSSSSGFDYYTFHNPGRIIYRPNEYKAMNFNSEASRWCFSRSKESDHFIVFWESGFGLNPKNSNPSLDVDLLLKRAEMLYHYYADTLGFVIPGNSKSTDKYKIEIFVNYSTEWLATGSGYDDKIGALWCTPWALEASGGHTVGHEIGHSFQYMVGCDLGLSHGWRYGFGDNGSGGCAWWESCAQWQAFKVYPDQQFANDYTAQYIDCANKNLLHQYWRYANYFIQDYWCQLHGNQFIGRLWRESTMPEDPVEAYIRITGIDQKTFNDQIFDYACRICSWDIDGIRERGKNYIDNQVCHLTQDKTDKNLWHVDSLYAPENYGYNIIRVCNAKPGTVVKANFKGLTGRKVQLDKAGWRYGFCAYKHDGTRQYGQIYSDREGTAEFTVPEGTEKMWFVVTGAPTQHWRHPWPDGDDKRDWATDEQWPYQVQFEGTNKYGYFADYPTDYQRKDTTVTINCELPYDANSYSYVQVQYDLGAISEALGLSSKDMQKLSYTSSSNPGFAGVNANGTISYTMTSTTSSTYFGHWFNSTGNVCNYDSNARIYAELTLATYKVNIGQYPGKLTRGKTYTIRQAVRYKPTGATKYYTCTFVVNVKVI